MFRPHLRGLTPVPHGGLRQLARQGIDVDRLLDFSATVLPGGPPASVRAALATVRLEEYPDPHAWELRQALADFHGLSPLEILPGNGSVELIRAVALTVLEPGDRALVLGPTFGEYAHAVRCAGGHPTELRTEDLAEVLAAIEHLRPKLLFVCNPNNPTGMLWKASELQAMESPECLLVLDEAYAGFLADPPPPVITPRRLTLRSMTKDFALAGLRLGYAIAPADHLAVLTHGLTPWGVSALAQAAGIAALSAHGEIAERVRRLHHAREELISELAEAGWPLLARETPFFQVRVGDADRVYQALLQRRILVRSCSSFGMPEWIRLSPRSPRDHAPLLEALAPLRTTTYSPRTRRPPCPLPP